MILGAAILIGVGVVQLVKSVRAGFLRHLELRIASRTWVKASGRAGYAARGTVLLISGSFLFDADRQERASEAGGMAKALI